MLDAANKWLGAQAQRWPRWCQPVASAIWYTLPLTLISLVVWLVVASETGNFFSAATGLALCFATWLAALLYGILRGVLGLEMRDAPFLLVALASLAYPLTIYVVGCIRIGYLYTPGLQLVIAFVALPTAIGLVWKYCVVGREDDLAA